MTDHSKKFSPQPPDRRASIEDLLLLAALPVLLVSSGAWVLASAYSSQRQLFNVLASLLMLPVTIIVLIRLLAIAWKWGHLLRVSQWSEDEASAVIAGIVGIGFLVLGSLASLYDMLSHPAEPGLARTLLMGTSLVILGMQNVALAKKRPDPQATAVLSEE